MEKDGSQKDYTKHITIMLCLAVFIMLPIVIYSNNKDDNLQLAYRQSEFLIQITYEVLLDPERYFEEGESTATIKDIIQVRPDLMINKELDKTGAFYYLEKEDGYKTLLLLFNEKIVKEDSKVEQFKQQDSLSMKLYATHGHNMVAINGFFGTVNKGVFTSVDNMRKQSFDDKALDVDNRAAFAIIL